MEFVVEHKHVVAPVLAGIAMTSLWFRAAKQSAEAELERSRANPAIKGRRPLCELDS